MKNLRIVLLCSALLLSGQVSSLARSYNFGATGLKSGDVVLTSEEFEMNQSISMGGIPNMPSMPGGMQTSVTSERGVKDEILEVSDGRVTKLRRTITKSTTQTASPMMPGGPQTIEGPLVGKAFTFTWDPATRRYKTDVVSAMSRGRRGQGMDPDSVLESHAVALNMEYSDYLFPQGEVSVGDAWKISSESLAAMNPMMEMANVSGSGNAKFLRIEKVGGEDAAVINLEVTFSGRMENAPGMGFDVTMTMNGLLYRSLATGVFVKTDLAGQMNGTGGMSQGGMNMTMQMSGPMSVHTVRSVE